MSFVAGALLIFAGVAIFSAVVPYNDDEFLQLLPLICGLHPGNSFAGCNPFSVTLVGTHIVLPLRAFYYIGSAEALLYLPVHVLWSSPIAVRIFHACFFVLGGWLLARKFDFHPRSVLVGLGLLFPYLFVHLADTATGNTLQIFSIYLLFLLIEDWCSTLRWKSALAVGFLIFFGFWVKCSYVWYVPGVIILCIMSYIRHHRTIGNSRIFLWQIFCSAFLAASLCIVLLLSGSPSQPGFYPYWDALIHVKKYATQPSQMAWFGLEGAWHAFLHPLDATQRIYLQHESTLFSWLYSTLVYFFTPVVMGWLAWSWRKTRLRVTLLEPLGFYLAFIATALFILIISRTGGMHHAILSYPFLILSVLSIFALIQNSHSALPPGFSLCIQMAGMSYVFLSIVFFLQFPFQPYRPHSDPMRLLVTKVVEQDDVASRYLVYAQGWGGYFLPALFSPENGSVIFNYTYEGPRDLRSLQAVAQQRGRKLMIIFSPAQSPPTSLLSDPLRLEPCSAIPANAAWQILAESDPVLTDTCRKFEWVTDGGRALIRNPFARLWLAL